MLLTFYRPGHWSQNVQNSAFVVQVVVWGFPIFMIVVRKVPFRIGLALLGFGVAIKPMEGDGFFIQYTWIWRKLERMVEHSKDSCFLEAFNVGPGSIFQVKEVRGLIWMPNLGEKLLLPRVVAEAFVKKFPENLRINEDKVNGR